MKPFQSRKRNANKDKCKKKQIHTKSHLYNHLEQGRKQRKT